MILLLRLYFAVVLVAMLSVVSWASLHVALWETPRAVAAHPWFIATLFDTYFAFLVFWFWVAWREAAVWKSLLWLVAICALGNIAIAFYMLIALFRLPLSGSVADLFRQQGKGRS